MTQRLGHWSTGRPCDCVQQRHMHLAAAMLLLPLQPVSRAQCSLTSCVLGTWSACASVGWFSIRTHVLSFPCWPCVPQELHRDRAPMIDVERCLRRCCHLLCSPSYLLSENRSSQYRSSPVHKKGACVSLDLPCFPPESSLNQQHILSDCSVGFHSFSLAALSVPALTPFPDCFLFGQTSRLVFV